MVAKLFSSACVIYIGVLISKTWSEPLAMDKSDNSSLYRLPKNVLPESYELLLLTRITEGNFTYAGEVNVTLSVSNVAQKIVLHSENLKILDEKTELRKMLSDGNYKNIEVGSQTHNDTTQFFSIIPHANLEQGRYILSLHFLGTVRDDLFGFYRSSYRLKNQTRWIGVTQFSPTFARRAFPCMDEPGFKATFQISIGHLRNETISSNTLPESRRLMTEPHYYITKFSRTPRMSTYLVGWAIHDFDRVYSKEAPRFSLWTRLFNTSALQPLDEIPLLVDGPKIYSALREWTGLDNPIGKFEQLAVPDFHFSAMENWGMVTFSESSALVSYKSTPLVTIRDNLETLAHEYAHTWFGNLVTPDFWDMAWLKEGFATYMAYLVIGMVHRDWRTMDFFSINVMQESLLDDSDNHSRTMNGKGVGSSDSALEALDFVTYEKGASIIRMIADVMGESDFQKAIKAYLQENQYKAVTPANLYKHLDSVVATSNNRSAEIPTSIEKIIETWANQPNYPLIRASRNALGQLQINQEPFHFNVSNSSVSNSSQSWWVPIRLLVSVSEDDLTEFSTWLAPQRSLTVNWTTNASWYLLNPRLVGYYRVKYDAGNWQALIRILNSEKYRMIPTVGRAGLIDDVFNLARAGYENYSLALDLIKYLPRETEYEPWLAACRVFNLLNQKFRDRPDVREQFRSYATSLMTTIYQKLNFNDQPADSHIEKLHRNSIVSTLYSLGFEDCVTKAKSIFDGWITDESRLVAPNLKSSVYRAGIMYGDEKEWLQLWKIFLETDLPDELRLMMAALGSTDDVPLVERYIEFAMDPDSNIARQSRISPIRAIVNGNSKNIDTLLEFVIENLDNNIYLRDEQFLGKVFGIIGGGITTTEQKQKLEQFSDKFGTRLGAASKSLTGAIKIAKSNVRWIDDCAGQQPILLSSDGQCGILWSMSRIDKVVE